MSGQDCETFVKRTGCTDLGKDYEHLYVTNLILKLAVDPTVRNFQLSSNDNAFGVFDDVVVEVEYTNATRQIYAIQLKHINKAKTLTKSGLAEKSGNFSIKKYHEDFTKLKSFVYPVKFVLFTNLKFEVPDGQEIVLAGDDFGIKLKSSQMDALLTTSQKGRCRQFTSSRSTYSVFFKDFFLYTNQANVNVLQSETRTQFRQMFSCDEGIFDQVFQFVTTWSLREGKKDKLNKNLIIGAIAIRLLTPHIVPLHFSSTTVSNNCDLLRNAMKNFQVTCCDKKHMEKIRHMWPDAKVSLDIVALRKINNMYQIISNYITNIDDLTDKECTKFLWLMGVFPLPVFANESFEKIITLCHNYRFVLFGTTKSPIKVFRNLTDLDPASYKEITSNFKCSLQGKEQSLESFIAVNQEFRSIITTNELLQMLDESLQIGGKKEVLPIPHIDRRLTRNTISMDFLSKAKNVVVVIDNVKPNDEQKIRSSFITPVNLITIEEFKKRKDEEFKKRKEDEGSEKKKDEVYFSEGEVSLQEVMRVCTKCKKGNYCQFRMFDGELEWVRSNIDISVLDEFRLDNKFIEQGQLYEETNDTLISIVCADPGMGKSILMKNLKNTTKQWTILMQPKDHSKYFRDKNSNPDDFIKYIVEKTNKKDDAFAAQVLNILIKACQVVFIWDGLDEVARENLEVIFKIINQLSIKKYRQWITSRCNLKNDLEKAFNIPSRTIEQFDAKQQNAYIEKRLDCTNTDLDEIKKKINYCIRLVQYNDILGIPLQIFMFTELFRQNPDKYKILLSSIFSITDLYRHFVDEKFNIYHQIKGNLNDSNDVMLQIMERSKNERLQNYEEVALKTYFSQELLDALKINCDNFLDMILQRSDNVGIIIDVTDDKIPSFLHNSYGEYFAASFLHKNHRKVPRFAEFVFEERYNNIRFLFDLLMAEECPAHIAVLYKNIGVLESHECNLARKDKGGRNPLHLASSWGRRFLFQNLQGQIQMEKSNEVVKEDIPEYQKILVYLSERCDPLESDELFHMTSFDYADHACCLLPILVMSNTHKFDMTLLKNFSDVDTVLYNAVKFDYDDVFEDIPFMTVDKGRSLLHVSITHGSDKCLKKMLATSEYLDTINVADDKISPPFLLACRTGHLHILETLKDFGADIHAFSAAGYSGIYIAARAGHRETVQRLLDFGLDINALDPQKGESALHLACAEKLHTTIQMLLDFGANPNIGDNFGYTPLYLATRHTSREIIQLLIDNGTDVNVANVHGDRPLFMAAWNGDLETVKLYHEQGADLDAVNNRGHGAIHAACLNKFPAVLEYLVKAGANVNIPNKYGQTPLHLAVRHHIREEIELLLQFGADVEAVNKYGENFWHMGSRYFQPVELRKIVIKAKGEAFWEYFKNKYCEVEQAEEVIPEKVAQNVRPSKCNVM